MNPRINPIPCFLGILFFVFACGTAPEKKGAALTDTAAPAQSAQGPKGDQGAAGKDGAPGPKGDQGATGPQGEPGLKADTSYPALGAVWTDPDIGTLWQFISDNKNFNDATCPTGWALPSTSPPFKFFGFFETYISTLPDSEAYWTSTANPSGHDTFVLSNIKTPVGADDASKHMTLCTKAVAP